MAQGLKTNKGKRVNQAGNDRAPAKVYVVGNAEANPDNVVAEQARAEEQLTMNINRLKKEEVVCKIFQNVNFDPQSTFSIVHVIDRKEFSDPAKD
ncbi:hypothetical protein Tco_0567502 [Tanacetum coccineum]